MSAKNTKLTAYVDGAARGNPGPAAAGVVVDDAAGKELKILSVALGHQSNNTAEYCALILALQEALMMGAKELQVYTDSELVVKQFNGEYKIKEPSLKALFSLVSHLKGGFKSLKVTHVSREKNKRADAEANRALVLFLVLGAVFFWTSVWLLFSRAALKLQLRIERLNLLKAE